MFGCKFSDCDGREVEVIDPGLLNTDSGPDFFNSKVKMGGTEWAGNIEIHLKASDWYRHGHDTDPAYDSIILHVVGKSDRRINRKDGTVIPQLELMLPEDFTRAYAALESESGAVRCSDTLDSLSPIVKTDWLESLAIERLQQKGRRISDTWESCGRDWEQTCFVTVARALGFGLNGEPFEQLARSLPLRVMHSHSDNIMQLQALLFGQAAMLDASNHLFDEFYQLLCREYYFLARKYGLKPMRAGLWKYARTRPQNFPHRRIALLAGACKGGFSLFSRLREAAHDTESLREIFNWHLDGYWENHYSFDDTAAQAPVGLSSMSVNLLLINAVAPLLYAYGSMTGDYEIADAAISLLESLPSEQNVYIRQWRNYGIDSTSAFRSQALIQLSKEYCDARKCLRCRFGHNILKRLVRRI